MRKIILLSLLVITSFLSIQAQDHMDIPVTPGTLSTKLTTDQQNLVKSITLTGSMDARDFKTIRNNLKSLETLDLKAVSIAAYTGKEGTVQSINDVSYPANTIPENGLSVSMTSYAQPTSIVLPDNLEAIAPGAFSYAKITSLSLPVGLKSIGDNAFAASALQKITLPAGVTYGENIFNYCISLTEVILPADMKVIPKMLLSNTTALGSIKLPEGLTTISEGAFRGAGLTTITIPKSVTIIESSAFESCTNLLAVTFEQGIRLTTLGDFVFAGTGLKTINLPAGVTILPKGIFGECFSLTSVTSDETITSIGENAFASTTSLSNLGTNFTEYVTELGERAFKNSGVSGILKFPKLTALNSLEMFFGCANLTSVEFSDNIDVSAYGLKMFFSTFKNSGIKTFKVPKDVELLDQAFQNSQLEHIEFAENSKLTEIGNGAFRDSKLVELRLPEGLIYLGGGPQLGGTSSNSIARDVTTLKLVEIPSTLTTISSSSFRGTSIETFINHVADGSKIKIASNAFFQVDLSKAILYVPDEAAVEQYKTLPVWQNFGAIKVIGSDAQESDIQNFADMSAEKGATLTLAATLKEGDSRTIKYSVEEGKEAVGTLNGNVLTLVGEGTIKVTALAEANNDFLEVKKEITVTVVSYDWLQEVAIAVSGNTAKVVGPAESVAKFTKFYVGTTATDGNSADISAITGEVELKATTANGDVVKLKYKK